MAWLEVHRISVRTLAEAVGVSHVTLGHWASGRCLPGLVDAYKVERVTQGGVPVSTWLGTDIARMAWLEAPVGDLSEYLGQRATAVKASTLGNQTYSGIDAANKEQRNGR